MPYSSYQHTMPQNFKTYLTWHFWVIFLLASAVMICMTLYYPVWFAPGDPMDYLRFAKFFSGQEGGIYIPWRTPGMPLFYMLTGVTWLNTWNILIGSFSLMSVLIPILVYLTLVNYSKTIAMIVALVSIVSTVPFAYSRVLMTEHLFHFFNFATICSISFDFLDRRKKSKFIYLSSFLCCYLTLIRPVAALYFWIYIVLIGFTKKYSAAKIFTVIFCYMAIMMSWSLLDRDYGGGPFSTSYEPTTSSQRRFAEIYFSGKNLIDHSRPIYAPEKGPDSAELKEILLSYIHDHPSRWLRSDIYPDVPFALFGKYKERPDELAERILTIPNYIYFNYLRNAILATLGSNAEDYMYGIAKENNNTGLNGVIRFFARNPMKLITGAIPACLSSRNLLGIFYFTGIRELQNHHVLFKKLPKYLINPQNGPYSKEFVQGLDTYIHTFPKNWEDTNHWYSRYKGNPDGFVEEIWNSQNIIDMGMWESFYFESLIKFYGMGPAATLFNEVALETLKANPRSIFLFIENILNVTLVRKFGNIEDPITYDQMKLDFEDHGDAKQINFIKRENNIEQLMPELKGKFPPLFYANAWTQAVGVGYGVFHTIAPIFVILAIFLLPFALLSKARMFVLFLSAIYLYNVLGIAVYGNFSSERYNDVFVLMPVLIVGLGIHYAIAAVRQKILIK